MNSFRRFLLLAVATAPLFALVQPAKAQVEQAKPAKSAQDCADELLRNKEAIAAAGETPQEFFHRCWWESEPGKPTPIKTPRATWDPGHSQPSKKKSVKPTIDARKAAEPKTATHAQSTDVSKPDVKTGGAKPSKLDNAKVSVVPKTTAETKPAQSKPPEPKSTAGTAASKVGAEPKPIESKLAAGVKKTIERARTAEPKRAPAAKPAAVVTAPDAAPASVKPVSSGAVVVKPAPRPQRLVTRAPPRHTRPIGLAAAAPPVPHVWHARPHWHPLNAAHRFAQPRLAVGATRAPGLWVARAPVFCMYAAPDALGRSACVPLRMP